MFFFDNKYSRETITRDLSFLCEHNLLKRIGAGAYTAYVLVEKYRILEEINIEKYFSISYIQREVKEKFNFEIFKILEGDIFTEEEKENFENLYNKFIKNFSKYKSQTIINKEFERIIIKFSWKSSVIEGNTYSLLGTVTLMKNMLLVKGKWQMKLK